MYLIYAFLVAVTTAVLSLKLCKHFIPALIVTAIITFAAGYFFGSLSLPKIITI